MFMRAEAAMVSVLLYRYNSALAAVAAMAMAAMAMAASY